MVGLFPSGNQLRAGYRKGGYTSPIFLLVKSQILRISADNRSDVDFLGLFNRAITEVSQK
jgi:hypothetical protein